MAVVRKPLISTITCTHNPRTELLNKVIEALIGQSGILRDDFEIVVIDNKSSFDILSKMSHNIRSSIKLYQEDTLGLTNARLKGLKCAQADIIVMVDDDNVLDADYLSRVLKWFSDKPYLGAIGGKSRPVFATPPQDWFSIENYSLGCRDLGDDTIFASWKGVATGRRTYPICAPIGGGMAIRRLPFERYSCLVETDSVRRALDRTGQSLASGGDNDMAMSVLEEGYEVGYDPRLQLDHHIPSGRLTVDYLKRYQKDTSKTWVQVLSVHGIVPWRPIAKWTVPLRKAKAYIRGRAWQSIPAMLAWQSACGIIEGRAVIHSTLKR